MNYTTALTLEYVFDKYECITYLKSLNINPKHYKYVHSKYDINHVSSKKNIRRLEHVNTTALSSYTNLMYISFDYNFNQKILNLPHTLTHIKFGFHFNKNVDNILNHLRNTLVYLEFGDNFDQKISNWPYPIRLTCLKFGANFNQTLWNYPNTLQYLSFGKSFNSYIPCVPENLLYLKFSGEMKYDLTHFWELPRKLHTLILSHYKHELTIPSSVKKFCTICTNDIWNLPSELNIIEIKCTCGWIDCREIKHHPNITLVLPKGLKRIHCGCSCVKFTINHGVTTVIFDDCWDHSITSFPNTLTHLYLGGHFGFKLPQLSNNLIYLRLGHNFGIKYAMPHLPYSLKYFVWNCNKALPKLPHTVTHLELGYQYELPPPLISNHVKVIYVCIYTKYKNEYNKLYSNKTIIFTIEPDMKGLKSMINNPEKLIY
jgi:hypothetical protein